MIDREKVLTVLQRRFPGAPADQIAAAANAIVGIDDEWEEITGHEPEFSSHNSVQCGDICYIADRVHHGDALRVFRRKTAVA